jgi:hypothetical protein
MLLLLPAQKKVLSKALLISIWRVVKDYTMFAIPASGQPGRVGINCH